MKKLLLLTLLALFIGCTSSTDSDPQNQDSVIHEITLADFRVNLAIGDTSYYKRGFYNVYEKGDSLIGYAQWIITKDTTIEEKTWLICEGTEYFEDEGTIDTAHVKMLVHQGETGLEVADLTKAGVAFLSNSIRSETTKSLPYLELRKILFAAKSPQTRSSFDDTTQYHDYTYELEYPLTVGKTWKNRSNDNPWGSTVIEKTCLGIDTIKHQAQNISTVKIEFLIGDVQNADDMFYDQWYDEKGIVKTYINYGDIETYNPDGSLKSTHNSYEHFTRIPASEMKVNELTPY